MHVDQAQPPTGQPVMVDESPHFLVIGPGSLRQGRKQGQDLRAVPQMPARQLANHEGVTEDLRLP